MTQDTIKDAIYKFNKPPSYIMEYLIHLFRMQLYKDYLNQTMIISPLILDHTPKYTRVTKKLPSKEQ